MLRRQPHQLLSSACRARKCLQQAAARFQSTAAAQQQAEEELPWESARPYDEIPGPRPLPILGNTWRFFPIIGKYRNLKIDELFAALEDEYGPLCKMTGMPGRPDMLVACKPEYVEKIMRTEGIWPVRQGFFILEHYFREIRKPQLSSLATTQGEEWQDFRTKVNQVMMQPRNTVYYVEPINKVTDDFIDRLKKIRDAEGTLPANMAEEMSKWSLESIAYICLDTRLGLIPEEYDPNSDAAVMLNTLRGVFDLIYDLDIKPSLWKYVSTPKYREYIAKMNTFTDIASKYVNSAMERLKAMGDQEVEKRQLSVLESLLIRSEDPDVAVSMALDMLMAGVDTTSASTSTVLYQLANNPEKQRKLQEELDRVIPDPTKPITKEQMEELRYLKACIKEAMRLMPILNGNFRNTGKDLVLNGYQVPKGVMTSLPSVRLMKDETYFPRANEFLPERWLGDGGGLKVVHPFAYMPFGFGPRMCVGRRFADLEMALITAKIFRSFNLEWNRPPAKTTYHLILSFDDPLQFTMKDRA